MSIEELKVKFAANIQKLHECTDYTADDARQAAFGNDRIVLSVLDQPDKQKLLGQYAATLNLGGLFKRVWKSLSGYITKDTCNEHNCLRVILSMYCNLTDMSAEVSEELGKTDCIPLLMETMDTYRKKGKFDVPPLKYVVILLVNSIQNCTENVGVYRRVNAVKALKKFLNSKNVSLKVYALRILAHIVDDKESKILQASNGGVAFLLKLLEDASSRPGHREQGVVGSLASALETLRCLNKLAVNDANKREIAKHGGIPVFVRMLGSDFSEDEQSAAVQALWNLSFIEEIRTSKELQSSVSALERLKTCDSDNLQHICPHALAAIKGQLTRSNPLTTQPETAPPSYEEAISQPSAAASATAAQVMISYQWDNQAITVKIREHLVQAGYRVWMDITHMRGSLLDAMAKAVETSSLVLVCMSEKYKKSENCRAEAQYAFTLKKPIIPLLLEANYKPDGWLGILGLTTLYHDVTTTKQLDTNVTGILKDIHMAIGDECDATMQNSKQEMHGSASTPALDEAIGGDSAAHQESAKQHASKWSKEDVQQWLNDNDLTQLSETFKTFKGKHLEKMYLRYCEEKTVFFEELKSDYKMDAKTRTEFEVALEEAFED